MACYGCNPCVQCTPTPVPTPLPPCVNGEPCEELVQTDCTAYTGPNLPALGIVNGDRLINILTKLHKVINDNFDLVGTANYTATNTAVGASPAPLVVTYLANGPIYTSVPGATNSGTTITVGSTTDLEVGMVVTVVSGTGEFTAGTVVLSIPSATTFTVDQALVTPLSANAVVKGTGSQNQIFTINVVPGTPQSFNAYIGSPVKVSGTGTIV